jgi:hypothetical protein
MTTPAVATVPAAEHHGSCATRHPAGTGETGPQRSGAAEIGVTTVVGNAEIRVRQQLRS